MYSEFGAIRLGKEPSVNAMDVFRYRLSVSVICATRTGKHVDADYLY